MLTRLRNRIKGGFTLIELMIVVAIIGILAAVAIPAFLKYIKKAKTTEAATNIRKIADGARSYFEEEHIPIGEFNPIMKQFPTADGALATTTANTAPTSVPKSQKYCVGVGIACPDSRTSADWTTPVWEGLKFSIAEPHYYQYQFTPSNSDTDPKADAFESRAFGDLNDNGTLSTFALDGQVNDTTGEVELQGAVATVKENE